MWKFEDLSAPKPTKVPYCATSGRLASVTNPDTWSSFAEAQSAMATGSYSGIGFVLTENDPFTFIDLDDTKGDQTALDRQIQIFNEFQSYAEKSPSGNGLHIICKGSVPTGRRRSSIEVYSSARYMTMTGDVYRDAPILDCGELLLSLWSRMGEARGNTAYFLGLEEPTASDDEVCQQAYNASNGEKFWDLYSGNWQKHYPSQSEADFALVDIVAFYSKNRAQIKRIFQASALGQRDKAKRDDYVRYMLNKCFDRMLPPVDIDGLRNKLDEAIAAKEAQTVQPCLSTKAKPESVYSVPPGLVGEIAQFIYEAAPRPVPEIALAGALGLISGIVGRAYNISGTGLNQYVLLLAPTGTGKEAIASGIDKLIAQVKRTVPTADEFIGPGEIASSQAVIKYMAKGPCSFVSLVGEFGIYMQQMASVNAPPHLLGLRRFLLDAYNKSGEGKVLRPSIYSDREKNTASVIAPAFSLMGESTPEKFYEGLHEGLISEGLLPRFTLIEYRGNRPALSKSHKNAKPSFEVVEKLSTLCAYCQTLNSQNKAIQVEIAPDALTLFDEFDKHCDDNINGSEKEVRRHLWNRAHMKALKLAAVVAVGCSLYDPMVTREIANWAITLVVSDVRNMLTRFEAGEIGTDNDETVQLSRLTSVLKDYLTLSWPEVVKYAGEGVSGLHTHKIVPYSYIQRRLCQVSIFRKDRQGSTNAIRRGLKTLVDRGDIQEISKAVLARDYSTTAQCFAVANPKAFGL